MSTSSQIAAIWAAMRAKGWTQAKDLASQVPSCPIKRAKAFLMEGSCGQNGYLTAKLYEALEITPEEKRSLSHAELMGGASHFDLKHYPSLVGASPVEKEIPFRSKKTLEAARGECCIKCGIEDGTTVSCHYTGKGQIALGKGTSEKLSDLFSAFLCSNCHAYFDTYLGVAALSKMISSLETELELFKVSNEFLILVMKTIEKKFKDGVHK